MWDQRPLNQLLSRGVGEALGVQFGDLLNQNFSSSSLCPEFAEWDWWRDLMRMQRLRKQGKTRSDQGRRKVAL